MISSSSGLSVNRNQESSTGKMPSERANARDQNQMHRRAFQETEIQSSAFNDDILPPFHVTQSEQKPNYPRSKAIHPSNPANTPPPQPPKTTPLGTPTFGAAYPNPSPPPAPTRPNLPSHTFPVFNRKKPRNASHAVSHELPTGANRCCLRGWPGELYLA